MILRATGLLPILVFDHATSWDDLLTISAPHLDRGGLRKLKKALEGKAKSVAVEKHYIDKDYRDTFTNYHAKRFSTPDSRCVRLHFFSDAVDHEMLQEDKKVQPLYMGYSIIRPTRPSCIGRTLLDPLRSGLKGAHLSQCCEKVSIQGTELIVQGFPFISQDTDVTVCAQSAMWMVARYFTNRYRVYPEVYPYRMTALTRDYSIGRILPSGGLQIWQMSEALRQIGFSCLIYDRTKFASEFEHLIYTYIESGIPVLAAFDRHVVALFGHVSDFSTVATTKPINKSPFIFSSAFNTGFIGHDDNGVPYQSLLHTESAESMEGANGKYKLGAVKQFIAALPERVFLAAESFEKAVTVVLEDSNFGIKAQSPTLSKETLVMRLFLTTGRSFKKCLRRGMGSAYVCSLYRELPLPHFIWVCEFSHSSIYPQKVWGEVLWDATRNAYEPLGFIALHYPEKLVYDRGSALNGTQELEEVSLKSWQEYPIYENNLVTA